MPDINEQTILDALSEIIDPDLNKDIVSLGFVKNIEINGKTVALDIELTTPACPVKAEFQQRAQQLIEAIDGIDHATIRMTAQPQPTKKLDFPSTLSDVRSIIAVSSCKGGVGKSTIAAQLAYNLAQRGFSVGLVDADLYGPSIPSLFNLNKVTLYSNAQKQLIPIERDNLKIMSFGFLLGDAPAVMRGPIVTQYLQQMVHMTAWGKLDYLFVDMPPGTGDIQLTLTQTVQLSGAVIVTTPQTLSLIDVARGILMFEKVNVPILGIVENMAYFECDGCSKKHYIYGKNMRQALNDRFGIDLLGELPLLPEMAQSIHAPSAQTLITEIVNRVIRNLGKSTVTQSHVPDIQFDPNYITLKWQDGSTLSVNNRDLRLSCQCALCVDEMSGEKILQEKDIPDNIAATAVMPLGNYALSITWNDRHASGIYPYKTIRALAQATIN